MIRETMPVGPLQCNCSILGDEVSREAIVVDPGAEIASIMAVVERHGWTVKEIIVTHAHIDHIAGAQQMKQLTGAPISYNQADLPLVAMMEVQAGWLGMSSVPVVEPPDNSLEDGSSVSVGGVDGITGHILHTPGHTPGSLCLYIPASQLLLAGDTLFAGSVGRTDLPGGDGRTLIRSIKGRLLPLPEETVVVPGHGRSTTISQERERNPFLQD